MPPFAEDKDGREDGTEIMAIRENPDPLSENPALLRELHFEGMLPSESESRAFAPVHLEQFLWMGPAGMITGIYFVQN